MAKKSLISILIQDSAAALIENVFERSGSFVLLPFLDVFVYFFFFELEFLGSFVMFDC